MTLSPYIFFNGNCADALAAYAEIFGDTAPDIMRFSDMPPGEMDLPPGAETAIMHASVKIAGGTLMMSDDIAGNSPPMDGCNVMVSLPTVAEGQVVFDKLADGGEVRMPYAPMFWTKGFGALTDKFGIRWMVTTDEEPDRG